jgi:hypothetical protein
VCGDSIRRTGSLSVSLFFLSILPAALLFLSGPTREIGHFGAYTILGVVSVSRFFLWQFDIAHSLLLQTEVAEEQRGVINGCQTAVYQLNWVILSVLAIYFADPALFHYLVLVSVGAVFVAAVGWSSWAATSFFLDKPHDDADAVPVSPVSSNPTVALDRSDMFFRDHSSNDEYTTATSSEEPN